MNRSLPLLVSLMTSGLVVAGDAACNVFVSLGACRTDAECSTGRCDVAGAFCYEPDDGGPSADSGAAADAADAPDAETPDGGAARCDPSAPFGAPALVRGFESQSVNSARFTSDELTAYVSILGTTCTLPCVNLAYAKRTSTSEPFVVQGEIGATFNGDGIGNYWPTLSDDSRLMFFESDRLEDGGRGSQARVWTATRTSTVGEFSAPMLQTAFRGTSAIEGSPYLLPDSHRLYFMSNDRPGNLGALDLYVAELSDFGLATSITNLSPLNSVAAESAPTISKDDQVMYFAREFALNRRIMRSTRAAPTEAWSAPQPVTEITSPHEDYPSWLSDDLCRLYFGSTRPIPPATTAGSAHLFVAERRPR